ncbi:MAG TPA: HEAT repeat domain-containing protein [Polyangiaceae bacterium]|nr:HEAT repeat domain-containing protein [Polyangiaceae bacterium]
MRTRSLTTWLALFVLGCARPSGSGEADGQAPPREAHTARAIELLEVENRRLSTNISDDDFADRDPEVRRLAARALARIGDPAGVPLLLRALSDEDAEVVAWSAYGLGFVCRASGVNQLDVVRALVTRAASLPDISPSPLDPNFAIARALGHCASEEAEKVLAGWLTGPPARVPPAALALGDVASRRKGLGEASQLALLAAASGSIGHPPIVEALYPFGRFDHPAASASERLLDVAAARLTEAGASRIFAVRALGRSERGSVAALFRVLTSSEGFTAAERIEAAHGLARQGAMGQRALGDALPALVPSRDPVALAALATSSFGPLIATLDSLDGEKPASRHGLYELAAFGVPKGAPPLLVRRIARVRCRAAVLLVNSSADEPVLRRCDPEEEGVIGLRAVLDVIAKRPLQGTKLAVFRRFLESGNARLREAAIELLASHPEVRDVGSVVRAALAAKEPGVVATAAQFVAAHPDRVAADVGAALGDALERGFAPDDIETIAALFDALGALRVEAARPKLEGYCRHPNPALREHALRALSLLGGTKGCQGTEPSTAAPELGHLTLAAVQIELATDAGTMRMTLDPRHAPVAVTRFADLARAGFYDGVIAHRVVPGFVVQFGDPGGDGFGGAGKAPLRCETTPLPFEPLDVGVALAGRDTGASQMFVTLARYPHLDQEYAWLGRAVGDWGAFSEGDVIRSARVLP